jgi:hypothetical protein
VILALLSRIAVAIGDADEATLRRGIADLPGRAIQARPATRGLPGLDASLDRGGATTSGTDRGGNIDARRSIVASAREAAEGRASSAPRHHANTNDRNR